MSDESGFPTDVTSAGSAPQPQEPAARWVKVLAIVGYTVLVLFFAGAMAFAFGSMWLPSTEQRTAYQQLRAAGKAPDYERQFHIPIPGCVCHSDDPVKVMQHSNRRINQCMGCHG